VIRITEPALVPESTSPSLICLCNVLVKALHQAGHLFTPSEDGVIGELAQILSRYGLEHVQTHVSTLEYRTGHQPGRASFRMCRAAFRTFKPFISKWQASLIPMSRRTSRC